MGEKRACPMCGSLFDSVWGAFNCCDTKYKTALDENRVLGSSRLTSFWSNEEKRTVIVTVLFWSDGSVTWAKE